MDKAFIPPHLEYAIQAPFPILSRDSQALESVQELPVMFVKEVRHVKYEAALQRLQLFSLIRKRNRGDLIYMYKKIHGYIFHATQRLLPPTRAGPRSQAFKIHQQRRKTRRR